MADRPDRPRLGFVVEHSSGHVTFYRNLAAWIDAAESIEASWYLVPFRPRGRRWKLPLIKQSWSLRAGLWTRRALAADRSEALLFHTQVPALLSPDTVARVPTFFSMDATPRQNRSIGLFYGPTQRLPLVAALSSRYTTEVLQRGRAIFAWTQWAADSLVGDYGIAPNRVIVLSPGVPPQPVVERQSKDRPWLLFVGADLARKGGDVLLAAFRRGLSDRCELHLVTHERIRPEPGIVVHPGLQPNDRALWDLYRAADIFVFPTLGDAFGFPIVEAMAAGLPVVASAVGGVSEIVLGGETGLLVNKGDAEALCQALVRLLDDAPLRRRMGAAGRARQLERYNTERNLPTIIRTMQERR